MMRTGLPVLYVLQAQQILNSEKRWWRHKNGFWCATIDGELGNLWCNLREWHRTVTCPVVAEMCFWGVSPKDGWSPFQLCHLVYCSTRPLFAKVALLKCIFTSERRKVYTKDKISVFNIWFKGKWVVLWAAELKELVLSLLERDFCRDFCSVVAETWLLSLYMLVWISVNLVAIPTEYYGEVISGEIDTRPCGQPQTNCKNLLRTCWGKEGREGIVADAVAEWASLPVGWIKTIHFEGFFLMVIWKLFVKMKQSDLAGCLKAKQPTWVRTTLQWF